MVLAMSDTRVIGVDVGGSGVKAALATVVHLGRIEVVFAGGQAETRHVILDVVF